MYTTYDKSGQGKMSFDLFVQSCIVLKRMTDVFKKYDEDRDGYITLSFEEFLTGEFLSEGGRGGYFGGIWWMDGLTDVQRFYDSVDGCWVLGVWIGSSGVFHMCEYLVPLH